MAMQVRVSGRRDLGAVRQALREVGDKGLSRQMSRGLQKAAKPLTPAVQKAAIDLMPSGYGPLMSKSVRVRTQAKERRGSASVSIRVFGQGESEQRDVSAINKGVLRHPVFGRSRTIRRGPRAGTRVATPWVAQRVRRGFVDRPVDRLTPEVRREMDAVVDWVADQITRG